MHLLDHPKKVANYRGRSRNLKRGGRGVPAEFSSKRGVQPLSWGNLYWKSSQKGEGGGDTFLCCSISLNLKMRDSEPPDIVQNQSTGYLHVDQVFIGRSKCICSQHYYLT